jgi:hypothetical protein
MDNTPGYGPGDWGFESSVADYDSACIFRFLSISNTHVQWG